jgi:hypothetical protein
MRLTILFSILFSVCAFAQKKIASINIGDEIIEASVDRVGDLYVVTKNGRIQKYDTNGKLLSNYKNRPIPTLFEPRDGSRLFAFFKKERKIEYLDPSFEVYTASLIDSAFVIDPWLAFSSGDHNIWILDAADKTLKKLNPRVSTLEVDVKIPENISHAFFNITGAREYQGFIFLLEEKKGIHIFNGLGRLIKTIEVPELHYFNFIGEELYYPLNDKLTFLNLFSGEQREMSLPKPFKIALLTDERIFLVYGNSVDFFEYKP